MQWKLVTITQSASAQKCNNWGTQSTTLGCKHNAKHTQERGRERERGCQEGNERQSAHSGALGLKLKGENQTCYWKAETTLKCSKCVHVKQNMYIIRMNGK